MNSSQYIVTFTGVVAVLSGFAALLVTSYGLVGFSDPAKWYLFARDFGSSFDSVGLAYGFPLLQAAAIAMVGPLYGFLVNVPLLVILAGLVYVFGRQQVDDLDGSEAIYLSPALAGAGALSFLMVVDWKTLLNLVNPYRDPLSHLLVLLACIGFVAWSRRKRDTPLGPVAVGCVLALAVASRETAVFMLGPIGLYAIASRDRHPGRLSARNAMMFGGALFLASVPLLIQNGLVSGNPVMPAQMAGGFEERHEFVPGIRFEQLSSTLPAVLHHLANQYGAAGLLVLIGVGVSIRYRISVALYLSLPAMLLHIGFYGAYARVVGRYLVIVDMFAAPLAGVGIAWIAGLALRAVDDTRIRNRLTQGAIALAFLPGLVAPVSAMMSVKPRFQLEQARRLRADLIALLPPGAPVMGDRPFAEILQCFVGDRLAVDHRTFEVSRLDAQLDRSGVAYVLKRNPVGDDIAPRFDAAVLAVFPRALYQLDPFLLYEVRPARPSRPSID
ncbi:MAG: hypothetical protein AAEJ52_03160 [Myxococcota bacterium]